MLSGDEGMEYTVQMLAKLAGVTSRTLRYYDEIGILKPARINSSGYRIYSQAEVGQLQQILFYRELDVDLETIKNIIFSPAFDDKKALEEHREKLLTKRKQLDVLLANVEKTLAVREGRMTMSDREKFEGFKQQLIDENEKKYGKEIREKYGDEQVDRSNEKIKGMSEEKYREAEKLGEQVLDVLNKAFIIGDPAGELAQQAADLHRQWLCYFWEQYTKEAHAGLAQLYVDDERFTAHYEKTHKGAATFFRDAVWIYTGMKTE